MQWGLLCLWIMMRGSCPTVDYTKASLFFFCFFCFVILIIFGAVSPAKLHQISLKCYARSIAVAAAAMSIVAGRCVNFSMHPLAVSPIQNCIYCHAFGKENTWLIDFKFTSFYFPEGHLTIPRIIAWLIMCRTVLHGTMLMRFNP